MQPRPSCIGTWCLGPRQGGRALLVLDREGRANRALANGSCLQHVVLGGGASPGLPAPPPWPGWHWYRAVGCCIALALLNLSTLVFQLMHKLSVEAPPKILVERYLIEIAKNYNVPYEPDSVVMVSQPQDVALQ